MMITNLKTRVSSSNKRLHNIGKINDDHVITGDTFMHVANPEGKNLTK